MNENQSPIQLEAKYNDTNMYIGELEKQDEVVALKSKLSMVVEDTSATLKILNAMFVCDNIELLYHDESNSALRDIVNNNVIDLKYLDKKSILGKTFLSQKSYVKNDIINDKRYHVAIDNPYKIEMTSQLLLCIVLNEKVQGIVRLSNIKEFNKLFIKRIPLFISSFKDIFLNEFYKKKLDIEKSAFTLNTTEVYLTLTKIKKHYQTLLEHTEHQEIKKLINMGDMNVSTILEYVNPNVDNVSAIKRNLNKLKKLNNTDENQIKIRVLIADDVLINVKILNSMLMDEDIEDIQCAYDGVETIEKMLNSYEGDNIINVLFLDHHMPGKMGSEVAEELRKKSNKLYIVSITNDPEAIKNKQSLYDNHIAKPFSRASVQNVFDDIKQNFYNFS